MEVRVCDDLINRIQFTGADIAPRQLFFVRGSIWRHCEASIQAGKDTSKSCYDNDTFSPLTGPRLTNKKYSKRSTLKWQLKNVAKDRILFLSLQQRYQLTNSFQFVKFDIRDNKNDINAQKS